MYRAISVQNEKFLISHTFRDLSCLCPVSSGVTLNICGKNIVFFSIGDIAYKPAKPVFAPRFTGKRNTVMVL